MQAGCKALVMAVGRFMVEQQAEPLGMAKAGSPFSEPAFGDRSNPISPCSMKSRISGPMGRMLNAKNYRSERCNA